MLQLLVPSSALLLSLLPFVPSKPSQPSVYFIHLIWPPWPSELSVWKSFSDIHVILVMGTKVCLGISMLYPGPSILEVGCPKLATLISLKYAPNMVCYVVDVALSAVV